MFVSILAIFGFALFHSVVVTLNSAVPLYDFIFSAEGCQRIIVGVKVVSANEIHLLALTISSHAYLQ